MEHHKEHQHILKAIHDQDLSINVPSGYRQGRLLLYPFNINYIYYNMKVTPQHKVIGPYNLDRIIHFIKKLMQRVRIEETVKRKDACSLKIKICVISCVIVSKH